jgi:hypothetical protein
VSDRIGLIDALRGLSLAGITIPILRAGEQRRRDPGK